MPRFHGTEVAPIDCALELRDQRVIRVGETDDGLFGDKAAVQIGEAVEPASRNRLPDNAFAISFVSCGLCDHLIRLPLRFGASVVSGRVIFT